ncbi:MAG TPA: SdrD B-like domain-containing protein [Saprospiraceae bacterium]|jgi:hypothetical protein|nr:SdrD B-like domain-containing protein [Saprospiraceae bacterium]
MKARIYFSFILFIICSLSISAEVTGTVFRDFNGNGIKEANEPLLIGVVINAYNSSNTFCGTTTTSRTTARNYSLAGCGTGPVRIEFLIPSSRGCTLNLIDFTSSEGISYGSSVQFSNGNSSNINYGVIALEDYFLPSENPKLYVPYCSNGDPANANVAAGVAFVDDNYDTSGPPDYVATVSEIGSTWGIDFSRQAQNLFIRV